jgi:ferredoxin-type protein NapH
VILDGNCTNCGRCIEVCAQDVFRFGGRGGGASVVALADPKPPGRTPRPPQPHDNDQPQVVETLP